MDLEALRSIFFHDNTFLPEPVMKKIATTLMVCTYNYETGGIPFNLDPKDPGRNPNTQPTYHRYYAPKYGAWIGRYMPDEAYEKFMNRQLLIWDHQLLQGKLGRFSQYSMPQEIVEARRFRHDRTVKFPSFALVK